MKTLIFGLASLAIFATSLFVFAGTKTEKIMVRGNCRFCRKHIEKAAKSLTGVKKAKWNTTSEILTLYFKPSKVNLEEIELAIAKAGHDTPVYKAEVEFYSEMPKCCKYRREELEIEQI
jgi:copper chaperone CopZ